MKTYTLSNGLEVVHIPAGQANISGAILLSKSGSRYETPETNGLSRFFALMSMKKTEAFPTQMDLLKAIDTSGVYVNVETNREYTALYVKSYNDFFKDALHVLSQMTIHQVFDGADIEGEKQYFQSEIAARQNDPQGVLVDNLFNNAFGEHSIAYSGVGSKDAVQMFGQNKLHEFRDQFYNAQNCTLVVCSEMDDIEALAEEYFKDMPQGEPIDVEPIQFDLQAEREQTLPGNGQVGAFALAFPAYSRNSEQKHAQLLLEILLGKTKSNTRLMSIFQEERLAQSLTTGLYQFSDAGLLVIQGAGRPDTIKQAQNRVYEEIEKITISPVPQDELAKAKGYYTGLLMLGLHDPIEKAFFYGLQHVLEGRVIPEKEFVQHVQAVDAETIQGIAQAILDMANMYAVNLG